MIPYSKQSISIIDALRVARQVKFKSLTQGNQIQEFENSVADYVGSKYAVAVSSATAGLHLAHLAIGHPIGSNVATSPISFVASANTIISEGESFASTIPTNSTSIGSAFSISNGVYFAKGQFLNVNDETILLDQYSNTPSYRVGLLISENVVNSDIDSSLNDNSKGFNNYTAPGADRLKITTSLFKKSLDDFDDNNFIELATVSDGILRSQKKNTNLSLLNDELARRTYSESGDYYVTPFDLSVKESLNNNLGNRGIFNENQLTYFQPLTFSN